MRFNTSFDPSRHESIAIQLMIQLLQNYIAFLTDHISSASEKFVEELSQVSFAQVPMITCMLSMSI